MSDVCWFFRVARIDASALLVIELLVRVLSFLRSVVFGVTFVGLLHYLFTRGGIDKRVGCFLPFHFNIVYVFHYDLLEQFVFHMVVSSLLIVNSRV